MVQMTTRLRTTLVAAERRRRTRQLPPPRPGLRVEPTEEKWRVLKHPSGARFCSSGSAEWPNDDFTRRRIRAGTIRLVEQQSTADE
jgi:hypothetical protein